MTSGPHKTTGSAGADDSRALRALLRAARASWQEEKERPKQSSARHIAVSRVLKDMGVAHELEVDREPV